MPRSRPVSSPLSFHKPTGQYYVTRAGKRVYLGADPDEALDKYKELEFGVPRSESPAVYLPISAKELCSRFIRSQQANWRDPETTRKCYRNWLGRFLRDHPGLKVSDLTVEMFATWKLSLRRRKFKPRSINHYLNAVRAVYAFAEDAELIEHAPRLRRVKNEKGGRYIDKPKALYTQKELKTLMAKAGGQMKLMILLGLNCGFGPKDIQDLTWDDFDGDRVTLPRSKTGICQTFLMWPETQAALQKLRWERSQLIERLAGRGRERDDGGHVFMTKYWRPWNKDAVAEQFRKLCKKAKVPCHGFYRLRHCASTAMSLVATPHVQRRFMRHSQLQQQVTYTHVPDAEVDAAITKARAALLGDATEASGSDPQQEGAA